MELFYFEPGPVANNDNNNDNNNVFINDCCCVKRVLKVSKLHNFVIIQDTDMFDTSL